MRGLYSGKLVRSRDQRSESEQITKVKVSPNVLRKTFYSDILEKTMTINVSTETIRLIRKYGSFDNYILLHPP
jgi:large subunit ribosomal protein L28